MAEALEQKARREIDADLTAAGWIVQDKDDIDLTTGRGVAVREFALKSGYGFADYLLYVDRKAAGAIEAKAQGTLTGVEAQSAKYAAGLLDNLPAHRRPLPFLFEANGGVTFFTKGLDPAPRSRQVFNFPRPEMLAEWVAQPAQLRARLKDMPPLDEARLWSVQARAIRNLEQSFGRADPRALVQMATGSGKTFTAVNVAYLSMSKDGRMIALITGEGRKPGNSDVERAAFHKSMIAYTGVYRTSGDEFITSVDASWNEAWNGSEQKRKYRVEGDRLIIDSAPAPSVLFPDRAAFARLVWQRDNLR